MSHDKIRGSGAQAHDGDRPDLRRSTAARLIERYAERSTSPVSADDIRGAAEVHKELGSG